MNITRFTAVAAAFCAIAGSAQAVTTGTHIGNFSGNDECPAPGGGKSAVAALGGSFCIAKFDLADDGKGEQGSNSALSGLNLLDNFTLTGAGTPSGTFSFNDQAEGIAITHMILKASNGFAVFDLNGATSGDWMTTPDLVNGSGAGRNISHLSFFGAASGVVPSIPAPAALPMLIAAMGGLALMTQRRSKG